MTDDLLQEKLAYDMEQELQNNRACPWCQGRGYQYLDGGRVQWRCPDCEGTGKQETEEEE